MTSLGPKFGRVTVYGAGVTGLTLAHELITRGFAVTVVEPTMARDAEGQTHLCVGGMAASQIVPVDPHENEGRAPAEGNSWHTVSTASQGGVQCLIEMDSGGSTLSDEAKQKLDDFVAQLESTYPQGHYTLNVTGLVNPRADRMFDASQARVLGRQRAAAVAMYLHEAPHAIPRDKISFKATTNDDLRMPKVAGAYLSTRSVVLPGEHGYRYFPSFYRHMYDTMQRIPLYDGDGNVTAQTVYDNLESSLSVTVARKGHDPILFSMLPPSGIQELRESLIATLASTNASGMDLMLIALRMLRYLTPCSARRAELYEDVSLLDFLQARRDGKADVRYSEDFLDYLRTAPRILAAIDPDTGDARTNANIAVQLLQPDNGTRVNGTLNGPTSTALFGPWVQHLRKLRVQFVRGKLLPLKVVEGKLRAEVELYEGPDPIPEHFELVEGCAGDSPPDPGEPRTYVDHADYVLTALDAATAETLSAELPKVGVPAGLEGYTSAEVMPPSGWVGSGARDPDQAWQRFQWMSGVQYFFRQKVDVADGHVYFSDSAWGLSSISEQQFWLADPNLNTNGYSSLISVDIGDFETPSPHLGRAAKDCTAEEIAEAVWRQMLEAIDPSPEVELPAPTWYHLDTNLRFDNEDQTLSANTTPLQVPLAGDWHRRPGADPHTPEAQPNPTPGDLPEGVWQSRVGGYYVHWDRLIYAGTWKKTCTRITTMEAGNESARHAVNALLDHRHHHKSGAGEGPHQEPQPFVEGIASAVIAQNPLGALARIWDPEQHEFSDFVPLKELDAELFARGLPHLFDVLLIETGPQAWSQLGLMPFAGLPNFGEIQKWTADAVAWQQSTSAALGVLGTPELHASILAGLRKLRELFSGLLSSTPSSNSDADADPSSEATDP